MASLQQKGNGWYCQFVFQGKRRTFAVGSVSEAEARTKAQQVDYLLMRLKQRLAALPPGMDIVDYIEFDGKAICPESPSIQKITLAALRDRYIATHEASLEQNTLDCIHIHLRHFQAVFGETFCVSDLQLADLQRYVDKRAKANGFRGRKLSPATIQKETITLRTVWNWAVQTNLVAGRFPNKGLRFPKTTEKPRFQTRAEIDRRIAAGGLTEAEIGDLWDALYLTVDEIAELLQYVKTTAIQPFVYPMLCFAAHTGARRSEIIRSRTTDVDFDGKVVTIHEKKRVKGKTTTRLVPLSPFLIVVLREWLAAHPGGQYLFCHQSTVARSKTRSLTTGHKGQTQRAKTSAGRTASIRPRGQVMACPLTPAEAHDHFKRVLADGKWEVLRGWHTLRHSMISACASSGVDQRLVESWAGHMSREMSRRYAHLYPSTQQEALARVFR